MLLPRLLPLLAVSSAVLSIANCGGATQADVFDSTDASSDGAKTDGGGARDGSADALSPISSCEKPGECEVGEPGCCGAGCSPSITSFVAIRRGEQEALTAATCDSTEPQPCPGCATLPQPNFQAFCRQKRCAMVDVRLDAISKCTRDDDCVLRPAECCPCDMVGESAVVAIARASLDEYSKQVCDPQKPCGKCASVISEELRARCSDEDGPRGNHCFVEGN